MKTEIELKELETDSGDEKTYRYGGAVIHIRKDADPESPRDWSNAWKWYSNHKKICFDRNWNTKKYLSIDDIFDGETEAGETICDAIMRQNPDVLSMRPIYLYEHSGYAVSLSSLADKWDSGIGAYAVLTKKDALQFWGTGHSDEELVKLADNELKHEVETFSQYLDGEVYGYVVEDASGNETDSCWGYYGIEDCIADAKSNVSVKDMTMHKFHDDTLSLVFSETTGTFCKYVLWVHDPSQMSGYATIGVIFMSDSGKKYPDGVEFSGPWFDAKTLAGMFGYQRGEFHGDSLCCWNEIEKEENK